MNERIVALDVGDRRIGIAVSDALGITAQPIETYSRVGYGPDVRRICQIAQQYETNRILCGLPLNMDGSRGFQAEKVAQLAEKLEEAGLVVSYYDERMTTVLAEDALLEANMSRENRKKKVDMVAAVMILQSYLDAQAMQSASVDADADDSDEDDGVLEMEDEDGNVIRFLLNATIPYHGEEYVLLVSEEACGDIEQDESFIMRKATDEEIELVEISDAEGNRAEMRRLATVEYSGKLYHILGAVQENETDDFSDDGLVLVRQDCTPDGADEYVITEDEREIEQVVGRYVIESLLDEIGEVSEGEETWPCGENHRPGEFCYCGQNEYLQ